MRIKFLCIIICLFVNALAFASAANRTITGVVISGEDNEPLIGASVYVHADDLKKAGASQTSLGTITDIDGKFSISVPEKVTRLHCSYIGFEEQAIALQGDKRSYRIVLQPSAHALADVVVTGYQTLERRKLTAAISKVELSDAMVGATKSIDQALTGQIAGVAVTTTSGAPGAPARIRIRGTASLNGTQDPLWVLDGMPLEGTDIPKMDSNSSDNDIVNIGQSSIAGLSPNDIESITILKDAAATAIYGARAANGVIVVTTKRGRTGKPIINFNTKLTYAPNLDTSRLNLMNSEEKVDLELQLMKEAPFYKWGIYPVPVFAEKGSVAAILKKHDLVDIYKDKGWNGLTPEAQNAINQLKAINTDWNDILFRDAFTQEYNFSISGGGEKVTYYNSLGYTKENGNVPGVSMSRFNLTSKTSYQINKLLKIGISIFANRRKNETFVTDTYGLTNPVYYSRIANPYFDPFDKDGNYLYDYDVVTGSVTDVDQGFNIFEERENTSKESITTAINSIFDAELRFNDQWKITSQIGVQWDQLSQEEYAGNNTFNMRHQRVESKYWSESQKKNVYLIPEGGMLKTANSVTSQITWKVQGEYKNTFNDIHDIQIMAGSEIRKNWLENQSSTGYGYDPKTLTFKELIFRDEKQAESYKLKSKSYKENAFASFFANGSYTLMNRYTLGGSIRMDGSDLFGVDKKYRYLPIYSVSGMWRLSNESFVNQFKWIDNLALRLSYGLQGNIDKNTSPFLVGTYKNISILPGFNEEVISIDSAPNSKLRWEKTTSYNVGLDFSVLNQAINLGVDYYYRKGTDLIGNKMLPLENGFTSMTVNWASMENKGIEINLQTRNITTKNFSWYTSFNFAYNQNKILKVMTNKDQVTPSLEGYAVGAIFALKTKRINKDTGQIYLENKDGKEVTVEELFQMKDKEDGEGTYSIGPSIEEQRDFYSYAGTSDAPYTGGFMNTFNYRNWELNINFSYNLGAHVRTSPTYDITDLDPGRNMNRDILDRWTPNNTNGKFPALATPNYNPADYYLFNSRRDVYKSLDIWVKKLSYVRLQNIRLAYRIPSDWLHKISLSGATVGLEARNLFVFGSSYKNYMDPESMGNLYSTPVPKSVTFNLSLNF
ncbi:SusC/RagA family TonB-linked outer membrane protein [Bacteroides sp.]|uniref:SusC/RagA family TonB-linked outer membrane protein n=1 Tax=Bacteroides sp. TaxID=29523 RepID=UPI0025C32201|nr:SusC/RagA family TonB-linked outer membrane protein [Bacteroides sp.]